MTTNEIMANLEKMSKCLDGSIKALNTCIEESNPGSNTKWHGLGMRDTMYQWKSWIDLLMEKHWKEEEQFLEATMFLHMND